MEVRMRMGFIGLGIMGRPMATNLLRAGFQVTAWNRSEPPRAALADAGATLASSPADAAREADVVIVMVTDSQAVRDVCLGPGGIIEGAAGGALVIDMSTISPEVTRGVGAALARRGIAMLDAPVSGGERGAIDGSLAIMVGGAGADLERARPALRVLGARIVHCGPLGAGQTVKLCNQIAVALTNLALCEALVFAQRSGVSASTMLDAIGGGAAASWQLANLGPAMLRRDFRAGFKVRLQQKDLRLALEAAHALHLPLPGAALVHQLFGAVEAAGDGEEGTQALLKALETLGQVRVSEPAAR
jgi:3-hydroxyisobutyrate dehydrogenase